MTGSTGKDKINSSFSSRYGIYKKALLLFLSISIVPLLIFGAFTLITLDSVTEDIVEKVELSIDKKVRDAMELQAVLTAESVVRFLKQREGDLAELKDIPPTDQNYLRFSRHHRGNIWIRGGKNGAAREIHKSIPLYKEIAFITPDGFEKIKIMNGSILPEKERRNVRDPENTTYLNETYFTETVKLSENAIFVSHLAGFHVSTEEQLGGAGSIEEAVEGKSYDGVIRFSTPIYDGSKLTGVVALALDHQHLMEFTQHILPNSKDKTVFPVYGSGNYAFMFDDRGWIITHPKYWDIPGVDKNGRPVKAYNVNSSKTDIESGRIPFNLDTAGFVHPNYPTVAKEVRDKMSGSVITTNIGGVKKIMAYAPIVYDEGVYRESGIFGGITIGAELQRFREPITTVAGDMWRIILLFRTNIIWVVIFTFILAVLASWSFSRGLTKPIVQITNYSAKMAAGEEVEPVVLKRKDEIGVLSNTFSYMAGELVRNKKELMAAFRDLRQSKEDIEKNNIDLKYQITILKSIQRISNILGSSLDINRVLPEILRSCVESLNFDRAVLYLIDSSGQYLELQEMYGFTQEEVTLYTASRFDLTQQDTIETRVVKNGHIIQKRKKNNLLETGLFRGSNNCIYVPLMIKERIIGIMGADRAATGSDILEIDVNSLQILANQASRIIENTRLYQEIIQQSNFVRDIVRNMIKGVITIDDNGTVTSINPAARRILNQEDREVVRLHILKAFPQYEKLNAVIQSTLASGKIALNRQEEYSINENNKILEVNISSDGRGAVEQSGSIIIVEDITEKKLLDDHLHRLDRLASMGKFAAGIAHEIRNPLTGISVFLDNMHDKLSTHTDTAKFVEMAISEIERLDNLVNELLDFASPGDVKFRLKDINEVLESTMRFVDNQCQQAGIKLMNNLNRDLPPLMMNSEKMRQALLNIILNSILIQDKGGWIRLSSSLTREIAGAKTKTFSTAADNREWIEISIEDDGPGIRPDLRSKIFEPFFSDRKGGTGLGLSITQTIITEHDGLIIVDASETGGAKFTIYLPTTRSGNREKPKIL